MTKLQLVQGPPEERTPAFIRLEEDQGRLRPVLSHHETGETTTGPHVHQARRRRHKERPGHRDEPQGVAQLQLEGSWAEEAELARLSEDQLQGFAGGGEPP